MSTIADQPNPPGVAEVGGPSVAEMEERIFSAALGALDVLNVYLGDRLGWYRAMAGAGALTADELADRTACDPRYAREWLEQQAASGIVTTVEPAVPGEARRFCLGAAATEVLTDPTSLSFLAPLTRFVGAAAAQLPALAEVYRNGGGVSWSQFGADARTGQADMNRPWYERELASALAGVPELHELLARPGACIADIGCGEGWSAIALARAYPEGTVTGYDPDPPSTRAAVDHATEAGLGERVGFRTGDAARELPAATYDAVFAFECLHDLPHPVEILSAARQSLRPGGVVVVMDEASEAEFTAPAGDVERLLYGFSTLLCLPDSKSHEPSAATGTVIRAATVDDYATRAGFAETDILPIEGFGFWRFYRLTP
jgi:SAM-dependent methyltransferase